MIKLKKLTSFLAGILSLLMLPSIALAGTTLQQAVTFNWTDSTITVLLSMVVTAVLIYLGVTNENVKTFYQGMRGLSLVVSIVALFTLGSAIAMPEIVGTILSFFFSVIIYPIVFSYAILAIWDGIRGAIRK